MSDSLSALQDTSVKPEVFPFFDQQTNTFTYIVKDPNSDACAVIDSVMDIDYPSGTISYTNADEVVDYIKSHQLKLEWILETHVHADHLSAAPYLKDKLGGQLAIGSNITVVQDVFAGVFNTGEEFKRDGSQFDQLLEDGDAFKIGSMVVHAIHTPGHTPACMTFVVGDAAFIGDTMFMPDSGTARVDFPGGDARVLFQSIQRVLSLAPETRLFMCHDYGADDREIEYETTVAREKAENIHVHEGNTEDDFVRMREARDATLEMPTLILPSLQVNMRAGQLPAAEDNDLVYLKLPINAFK